MLDRPVWFYQLPHNLYSWLFIFMQCFSCLHGIADFCWWTVTPRSFSENTMAQLIVLCCVLVLSTVAQHSLLVWSQMFLILIFLKIVFLVFLTSICTNAVPLQLQFSHPSGAHFQFSHRITNGTQNRYGPGIEFPFWYILPSWWSPQSCVGLLVTHFYVIDNFCCILCECYRK